MTDATITTRLKPGGSAILAGRPVARIGYGAMQLERHHADPATGIAVLRRAVELGIDHVDTAQFYGDGFVNGLIRGAISGDHVLIATKVGAAPNPEGPRPARPAQKPAELRTAVEDNLRSLGLDTIPLVYLRRLEVGPGLTAEGDQIVDVDEQLAEMTAMRDEGKIGAIGLSAVTIETLRRALPAGIEAVQNWYNVIDRRFEDTLKLSTEHQIGWVPFFPLGSSFPGMAKVPDDAAVRRVASDAGLTPSQIGLAWLLAHAPNTFIIPGTGSIGHLDQNTAVGDIRLTAAALNALDAAGADSIAAPIDPPRWPGEES